MGEEELNNLLPEGCIYYDLDKLKDKVRSYSNERHLVMCLYIGEEPPPPIEGFDTRICVESYSEDVVKGVKGLIEKGVQLLRIYDGLSLTELLDAKEAGILKKPLKTIDKHFVR